jgi:uncharacterized protein (TIGR04255 family)
LPNEELKYKPLIEAIVEIHWVLPPPNSANLQGDPYYSLLLGRFSERVQEDYPFHEVLPSAQMPEIMVPNTAQHRFRIDKEQWPLIQIGPGMLTFNETDRYKWHEFKSRCEKAVDYLYDAHPEKKELVIQDLILRYIDAVEVDFSKEDVFQFLNTKMKINISLPSNLFNDGNIKPNPTMFDWQVAFPNDNPGGSFVLRFHVGQLKNKPALIWETIVHTNREKLPDLPSEFSAWLTKSHDLTDDWFYKLIDGDLKKRFSGE